MLVPYTTVIPYKESLATHHAPHCEPHIQTPWCFSKAEPSSLGNHTKCWSQVVMLSTYKHCATRHVFSQAAHHELTDTWMVLGPSDTVKLSLIGTGRMVPTRLSSGVPAGGAALLLGEALGDGAGDGLGETLGAEVVLLVGAGDTLAGATCAPGGGVHVGVGDIVNVFAVVYKLVQMQVH